MENKIIFLFLSISIILIPILAESSKFGENDYKERIKTMSLFFPPLILDSVEHAKIKGNDEALKKIATLAFFCLSCPPELLEAKKPLEKRNPVEKRNQEKWYNKITRNDIANIGITVLSFIPGIFLCGGIEHLKAHYHFFLPAPQPEVFIPYQSGTN